jgi:ferritin-like metal-binding protein YciE
MKSRQQKTTKTREQESGSAGSKLRETFLEELKDLYDAEKQLLKALPKMAKAAENEELRTAFETHLEETEAQVTRLDEVFGLFEETPRGRNAKACRV